MPDKNYTIVNSGTNNQGNHWCTRDYGPETANQNS
ncbi:hypothetical protein N7512_007964 [Penicillium capsulatum]|nr:hypothetical protein N7512_007964 [Penicillium capsulatum]